MVKRDAALATETDRRGTDGGGFCTETFIGYGQPVLGGPGKQIRATADGDELGVSFAEHVPRPRRLRYRVAAIGRRRWLLAVMDTLVLLTTVVAVVVASRPTEIIRQETAWMVTLAIVIFVFLAARGAYRHRLNFQLVDDLLLVVGATIVAATSIATVRVIAVGDPDAAAQVMREWLIAVACLVAARGAFAIASARLNVVTIPTVIIGAGRVGRLAARRLLERPGACLHPVAYIDTDPLPSVTPLDDLPVLTEDVELERLVHDLNVGQVLLAFSSNSAPVHLELVQRFQDLGVPVALVPRLYESMTTDIAVENVGGVPFILMRPNDPYSWRFQIKYGVDRIGAAVGLALLSPIFLAASVAVLVSLGRPIFFRQTRVGRDLVPFEMLKFRTMRSEHAGESSLSFPEDTGPGGVEGDDRRTRTGRLLRRMAIDELPQLVNVLRGEMSLVGPRPERPDFVRAFIHTVPRYGDRYRVKSGITGWAQVAGLRGKTSLSDRVAWDNWYIENWSARLDLKILLATAAAIWQAQDTE